MSKAHAVLKFTRKVHLLLGIFTTPALLFFAFTGAMQTFSLHETTQGSAYKPPAWIASLAQLHKKQDTTVPVRKLRPPAIEGGERGNLGNCIGGVRFRWSFAKRAGPGEQKSGWPGEQERRTGACRAKEPFTYEDLLSSGVREPGPLDADRSLYVL